MNTIFKKHGLELNFYDSYFLINNTRQISDKLKEKVKEILKEAGYCYLNSENRMDGGKIAFTVTPYQMPEEFKKWEVTVSMSSDELWQSVESAPRRQTVDDETCQQIQNHMSLFENVNYLMREFFEKGERNGEALDLGCGIGANSRPLLKLGWKVTGIDRNAAALQQFSKFADNYVNLIQGDVTQCDLPKNKFNLVIALQLLNYLEPKSIRPLLKKIYDALLPNGTFIGTMWFDTGREEGITKFGVYLYKKEAVPALLVHSGFTIEQCIPNFEMDHNHSNFVTFQFIGKKQ